MTDQPTREELVARIDELEAQLAEVIEHAARDRALIRQQLSETEDRVEDDLQDERNTRGREDAKITRRLSEVEDRLDIDASEAFATADGGRWSQPFAPDATSAADSSWSSRGGRTSNSYYTRTRA